MIKRILTVVVVMGLCQQAQAIDLGNVISSGIKFGQGAAKASKEMTPVQEYYLGRAVAAQVVMQNPLYNNAALTDYVNKIGQTIVNASDRPETYGGYHFAVLNDDGINAYACPGGFIFVTRGAVKAAKSEDELAAVLAHEVAHVTNKHSLKAIKKAAWTGVALTTLQDAGAAYGSDVIRDLTAAFGGAVSDVTSQVLKNGFSRNDEKQADEKGLEYMTHAGYNPAAMVSFFQTMLDKMGSGGRGVMATHAATDTRIKVANAYIAKHHLSGDTAAVRTARFAAMAK